ncbi:MAG: carboxymethylenebutenolidase [Frankiales bacterium]|nr:carboxymethylenebutenolidase [Frankiales bacterium]
MRGDLTAETISIAGDGGDQIEAYLAVPLDEGVRGGVVVIHHLPGYDAATKEIVRRFAAEGFNALCPNLYSRDAPGADADDAAALVRAQGGVPDDRLVGDVAGAAAHLRSLASSNGKVGSIGYCSGGRQSFLSAARVDLQAAVDCYGAFVVGEVPEGFPLKVGPLEHLVPELRCPLLGLFGRQDSYPSPADMERLDGLLTAAGKPHSFHFFEGAGHGFFSVDRPSYRPEAAKEGWRLILDFYREELS